MIQFLQGSIDWVPSFSTLPRWLTVTACIGIFILICTFLRYQQRQRKRIYYASIKLDPHLSLFNYLKCLTYQSSTKEKFMRSTPFHRVYATSVTETNHFRIKEPRPFTIYWPILNPVNYFSRSGVVDENEGPITSGCRFRLKIGKGKGETVQRIQVLACNAVFEYLGNTTCNTSTQIDVIINVLRAVGFFHGQKVPLISLDWSHPDFIKYLAEIGKLLPPTQYVVTAALPHYAASQILFQLNIRGIFKKLSTKALSHLDHAKERAREKMKEARDTVTSSLSSFLDFLEDEESQLHVSPKGYHQVDEFVSKKDNFDMLTQLELQMFWNQKHVALKLIEILKTFPLDLQSNLKNPLLIVANNFRKRIKPADIDQEVFDQLYKRVTACKLGLKNSTLEKNPSFYTFAIKNALHRYLMVYNHVVRVADDDSEAIFILFEGEYRRWSEIEDKLERDEHDPLVITGQYSAKGLVNQGLYDWVKLEPFIQAAHQDAAFDPHNLSTGTPPSLRHDWGNRYILEFCSWILEKPRLGGDHLWIRLKTPEGLIYSVGQYRPKKFGFHEQFIFPMKIKMSVFCAPDICEFWTGPYTTLSIAITESQFHAMKERIEQDQAAKEHVYQLFHDNCVKYAMSIAQLGDIQLPTELKLFDLLMYDKLVTVKDKLFPRLPLKVQSFGQRVWAFCFNWISLIFGAGVVSQEVKKDPRYQHIEPFIRSIEDMTDPQKVVANHPFVIGEYCKKDIEKWRIEQSAIVNDEIAEARARNPTDTAHVTNLEKKLEDIQYDIPPKYRVSKNKKGIHRSGSFEDFHAIEE